MTFPWAFFQLGSRVRHDLGELNVKMKSAKGELSEIKRKAVFENVTTPSHLLLLARRQTENLGEAHEDYATLSCSVQIISEFLWSHQIGTKWSTGGWAMNAQTYEICKISPQEFVLEGALMIGKAAIMPPTPKRPALETVFKKID